MGISFIPALGERGPENFNIPEYAMAFQVTCESVPEQYDVFIDGVKVAYVRLRSGWLTVGRTPDPATEFLRINWVKDKYKGNCANALERAGVMTIVAHAILAELGVE